MSHPSRKRRSRKAADKPAKPYPDFPLAPHASGAWQKKIRGKIHYFGRWARRENGKLVRIEGDGWREALEAYKAVADDLHAGRTPRVKTDGLTVADLCNAFLTAKSRKVAAGELTSRAFMEYKEITDLLVASFGKTRLVEDLAADDFESLRAEMAERWGPVRLGNGITRVKSVFKYGTDNGLVEKTVRYGGEFRKPDKAVLRRHKAAGGARMLEAPQVRLVLDALAGKKVETGEGETVELTPNPALRAMVLLAVNAGYGNMDVATLPVSALDLHGAWLDYPRPKTGIARRCWLWPETIEALRAALAVRPAPKDEATGTLAFLNSRGCAWIHLTPAGLRIDNVTIQFAKALRALGLHREGIGFYTLRHVFRTVADAARDPVAIDVIMGHTDPTMGGHYRERVEDDRLRAVAEVVRAWLFGTAPAAGSGGPVPEAEGAGEGEPEAAPESEEGPALRLYVG